MAGNPRPKEMQAVIAYFEGDFALHIQDEHDDLFPMLRTLAASEDAIDPLLDSLSADRSRDERIGRRIVALLAAQLEREEADRTLDAPACREIRRFTVTERRHLMFENAIVLPLARIRLDAQHQQLLRTRMKARRDRRRPGPSTPPSGDTDARRPLRS